MGTNEVRRYLLDIATPSIEYITLVYDTFVLKFVCIWKLRIVLKHVPLI